MHFLPKMISHHRLRGSFTQGNTNAIWEIKKLEIVKLKGLQKWSKWWMNFKIFSILRTGDQLRLRFFLRNNFSYLDHIHIYINIMYISICLFLSWGFVFCMLLLLLLFHYYYYYYYDGWLVWLLISLLLLLLLFIIALLFVYRDCTFYVTVLWYKVSLPFKFKVS